MKKPIIISAIVAALGVAVVPAAALAHGNDGCGLASPVVHHRPISVVVVERYSVDLPVYRWVGHGCHRHRVQVGTRVGWRKQSRTVTATWHHGWGSYSYLGLDGQIHAYRR